MGNYTENEPLNQDSHSFQSQPLATLASTGQLWAGGTVSKLEAVDILEQYWPHNQSRGQASLGQPSLGQPSLDALGSSALGPALTAMETASDWRECLKNQG